MYHLCKRLADLIFFKYQETYSPEQLEDVLRTGFYGDMEDVSDLIAQCAETHVEKMLKVFGRQWSNLSKLDAVIFGGGGMQPLYRGYLLPLRQFANNSTLLDRFAVLRGYRRSGLYKINRQGEVIENGEAADNLREAVQFYLDYSEYEDVLKLAKLIGVTSEEAKKRIQSNPIPPLPFSDPLPEPARSTSREPTISKSATPRLSSIPNQDSTKGRVDALLDDD